MVERIEWLDYCICAMLSGKKTPGPLQWGLSANSLRQDIDLLRQSAQLVSLRAEAARPDPGFVARLREQVLAEAAGEE